MASGIVYEARHTDGRAFIGTSMKSLAQCREEAEQRALRKSRRGQRLSTFEVALVAEPDAFTWYVVAIAPRGRQLAEAKQRAVADWQPSLNHADYFGPLALIALRPETLAACDALAARMGLTQRRLLREAVEIGIRVMRSGHGGAVEGGDATEPAAEPVAPQGEDE